MSSTPASIPKPVLKGLHNATIKRNLVIVSGMVAVVGVAYKMLVCDPRKAQYAEFYKKYDANKSFERMRANGRFQSC